MMNKSQVGKGTGSDGSRRKSRLPVVNLYRQSSSNNEDSETDHNATLITGGLGMKKSISTQAFLQNAVENSLLQSLEGKPSFGTYRGKSS